LLELTADNAADYLRRQGWLAPGPARVELLSGGVSNAVLRVEQAGRLFVVKQSRPRLRTRDEWFSDVGRVYREQEVMQLLRPLLPAGTVPEVLFSDRANYVFAMSHAPREARVWKEQLLAGEVDPAMGEWAGRVLGQMHERTGRDPALVEAFRDSSVFVQLRVDPYYRRVQERRPEVAAALAPLIEGLLTRREVLCHGDYSPKNMLTHAGGFTLVDYETAYFGDPAMDLGFFLSHLLLKACKRSAERGRYFGLTEAFWAGYGAEVTFRDAAELQRRGIAHLGACLLARVDGTSPVDYLAEAVQREAVRRLGRALLLEAPRGWGEVLARAEAELRQA
jgi:aminoglycoside phosphotransferase (APT) family kinase protein